MLIRFVPTQQRYCPSKIQNVNQVCPCVGIRGTITLLSCYY